MAKQSRFRDHRDRGEHRQPGGRRYAFYVALWWKSVTH